MPFGGFVADLLARSGVAPGDVVEVETEDNRATRGRLMDHHDFSAPHVVTLKLDSGYNVGVALTPAASIRLVARGERVRVARSLPPPAGRPPVSILGTGGTIASFVDYRTGGVYPATTPEELALAVPELFDVADVRTRIVFSMFSEDLQPEHWQRLAREVKSEFDRGARGVVVTHGTDTMSYTAAALSFFLKDLPGPVVITGAQRSSDRPSSDASLNLLAATTVAATTDVGEVVVVMHGGTADSHCAIHRGTRVRKMHTSRRDAFQSMNARPIGRVVFDLANDRATAVLDEPYRCASAGPVVVDDAIDEEVSMIQTYPGLWPDHLEKVVLKGVIIVGTGLGHIARRNLAMLRAITSGQHEDGRPRMRYDGTVAGPSFVVMTSQCLYGRVNMAVYSTGRDLLAANVMSGDDMLPETAYIKLMWVLGRTQEPPEVRRLMGKNLVGELDDRSAVDTYPEAPAPDVAPARAAVAGAPGAR